MERLFMSADIYHFARVENAPNRIRELRNAAVPRLSQQALADIIGVSKVTISDLERGAMQLTQDYMRRIASALNVAPADILPLSENPNALSANERELLEQYRQANDDQRDQLKRVADVLVPFRRESYAPQRGKKRA